MEIEYEDVKSKLEDLQPGTVFSIVQDGSLFYLLYDQDTRLSFENLNPSDLLPTVCISGDGRIIMVAHNTLVYPCRILSVRVARGA